MIAREWKVIIIAMRVGQVFGIHKTEASRMVPWGHFTRIFPFFLKVPSWMPCWDSFVCVLRLIFERELRRVHKFYNRYSFLKWNIELKIFGWVKFVFWKILVFFFQILKLLVCRNIPDENYEFIKKNLWILLGLELTTPR